MKKNMESAVPLRQGTINSDEEIQEKLDLLLTKYQSQNKNKIAGHKSNSALSLATISETDVDIKLEEIVDNEIPVLTEVVILRSSPLRSVLDDVLDETQIDMNARDREKLARALDKRFKHKDIGQI